MLLYIKQRALIYIYTTRYTRLYSVLFIFFLSLWRSWRYFCKRNIFIKNYKLLYGDLWAKRFAKLRHWLVFDITMYFVLYFIYSIGEEII